MEEILTTVGFLLAGIFGWFLVRATLARWAHMKLWERQGVPGPVPNFFLGNVLDYFHHGSPTKAQSAWLRNSASEKTTGTASSTVGFFMGGHAALVTSDPQLIRTVFVADAEVFPDHQRVIVGRAPYGLEESLHSLIYARPERWIVQRRLINRAFTPSKLKGTFPIFEAVTEKLIKKLKSQSNSPGVSGVNLFEEFKALTTDLMLRSSFGYQDDDIQEATASHPLIKTLQRATDYQLAEPFIMLAVLFPSIGPLVWPVWIRYQKILRWLGINTEHTAALKMVDHVKRNVQMRDQIARDGSQSAVVPCDLLQSMMDERASSEVLANGGQVMESHIHTSHGLTNQEIYANGVILYVAGYDTSSTTMSFTIHYLVNDQDLQDRVREEVLTAWESLNGRPLDYDTVGRMELLEAVIKETLRFHPPIPQLLTREAVRDYTYRPEEDKDGGLFIPKGTAVIASADELHFDPQYWDSPLEFRPERFMADKETGRKPHINPFAYLPFGVGPRLCIGQRFAMLSIKFIMAHLLATFRLVPCGRTELGSIEKEKHFFFNRPANGVWVRLESR